MLEWLKWLCAVLAAAFLLMVTYSLIQYVAWKNSLAWAEAVKFYWEMRNAGRGVTGEPNGTCATDATDAGEWREEGAAPPPRA